MLFFAPLQGTTATSARAAMPDFPAGLDTVVYCEQGRIHRRSRALLHACKHLGLGWRLLGLLRYLPAFVTDVGYRIVAWSRYRLFGRYDRCQLPRANDRSRFLP